MGLISPPPPDSQYLPAKNSVCPSIYECEKKDAHKPNCPCKPLKQDVMAGSECDAKLNGKTSKCLCMCKIKTKAGVKVINRCSSHPNLELPQMLLACTKQYGPNTQCLYAIDSRREETCLKFHPAGGALTFQYTVPRTWTDVYLTLPPTSHGGKATKINNLFHFKVQCFIGFTSSNAKKWHTLFDTQMDKQSMENKLPGVRHFVLSAKCPVTSDTWRLSQITAVGRKVEHVSLCDFRVASYPDVNTKKPLAPVLPPMHNAQMQVSSKKYPIEIVVDFTSAKDQMQCIGLMPHAIVKPNCRAVTDGDVNTPQIFSRSNIKPGIPKYVYSVLSPRRFDAVYMYAHKRKSKRQLQSFNVECFKNERWETVLDQSSSQGSLQFKQDTKSSGPWRKYVLTSECLSQSVRITKFNNNAEGHFYIFEIKFLEAASTMKLPECTNLENYQPYHPCLPKVQPPRIQGWCVAHNTVVPQTKIGTLGRRNPKSHVVATIPNIQHSFPARALPCGSKLAIELVADRFESKKLTRDGCVVKSKLTVKDKGGSLIPSFTMGCTKLIHQPMAFSSVKLPRYRQADSIQLQLKSTKYYYGHTNRWSFSGNITLSYWWQPVDRNSECTVPIKSHRVSATMVPAISEADAAAAETTTGVASQQAKFPTKPTAKDAAAAETTTGVASQQAKFPTKPTAKGTTQPELAFKAGFISPLQSISIGQFQSAGDRRLQSVPQAWQHKAHKNTVCTKRSFSKLVAWGSCDINIQVVKSHTCIQRSDDRKVAWMVMC